MAKYLKDIKINFISLVRKGANNRKVIFKSADASEEMGEELKQVQAVKKDDVKQMIYGVVYAPDETDAHGHTADTLEIERAAYGFMKSLKALNIDKGHSFKPDGGAYVAESWIVRDGDPLFPREKPGAWAVGIKCEDAALYEEAKTELPAISMAGTATIITKEAETDVEAVGLLRKLINFLKSKETITTTKENDDMEKTEVQALIKEAFDGIAKPDNAPVQAVAASITKLTDVVTGLSERLEKIEKATPGTKQDQTDTADIIKQQEELGIKIGKMAMRNQDSK